jgi:hypothetical protein
MAGSSWLDGGGNGKAIDVHEAIDAQALIGLLDMVQAGALVSLGTTSDGGALAVTVTIDGEWRREYVRNHEEVMAYLAEAVPGVLDLLAAPRASSGRRQRTRRSKAS